MVLHKISFLLSVAKEVDDKVKENIFRLRDLILNMKYCADCEVKDKIKDLFDREIIDIETIPMSCKNCYKQKQCGNNFNDKEYENGS